MVARAQPGNSLAVPRHRHSRHHRSLAQMKTNHHSRSRRYQRGWVLWLFLVIVAGTIALCKALVDATNAVYPANPPPPPPPATNMPPTNCLPTNPPINLAIFIPVVTNSGPLPSVVTISFGLMPDDDGNVSAMVVSVTPPNPN